MRFPEGMKWFTIVIAVLFILYFVLPRLRQVSVEKAVSLVGSGARFIDVRSEQEFRTESVPGSDNVPVHSILSTGKSGALNPDEPIVLFCQSGMRSGNAARQLKSLGFTEVYDLGTFHKAWKVYSVLRKKKAQ
jgi:rhodanese-related sulfurtransferase